MLLRGCVPPCRGAVSIPTHLEPGISILPAGKGLSRRCGRRPLYAKLILIHMRAKVASLPPACRKGAAVNIRLGLLRGSCVALSQIKSISFMQKSQRSRTPRPLSPPRKMEAVAELQRLQNHWGWGSEQRWTPQAGKSEAGKQKLRSHKKS